MCLLYYNKTVKNGVGVQNIFTKIINSLIKNSNDYFFNFLLPVVINFNKQFYKNALKYINVYYLFKFIFRFYRSGVEAKRCVEFLYSEYL